MFAIEPINVEYPASELVGNEVLVLFSGKNVIMAQNPADRGTRLPTVTEAGFLLKPDTIVIKTCSLDGVPCCGASLPVFPETLPAPLVSMPCRAAFMQPTTDILNAISRTRTMALWRRQHHYCGGCRETLQMSNQDLALVCPGCKTRYYPQIAPAVIIAISRNEGRELLLAHNRMFEAGIYSLIAGFVEAGESVEQAVAREIMEETKIKVKNITYLSSQPWPFPNSLMLAFSAEYDSGTPTPDGTEIEDIGWFTKETMPHYPSPGSIAHHVITKFFNLCN